ncbi:MAG: hypothetical protein A2Z25_05595 [Planctomycetes bacterium RBG_16_55_9]|nr:MAG: hypothetical protein A2Z25_05595 [Planctomycetes bacterium RBG_16_55_9]
MNLPNIKDILGKLSVFKNNMALLAPVIIVVVAVLLFVPTQLMSRRLRSRVEEESIRKGATVITKLKGDPISAEQYQIELVRQEARANDANEIERLAVQTTERELLSYDIFPEPDPNANFSAIIFQVFGERFRSGIDGLVRDVKGLDCPTNEEIQRALENSSASRSRMGGRGAMMDTMDMPSRPGMPAGGGLYPGLMPGSNISRLIMDEICEARAKSISVYVNPRDIAGYEYWANFAYEGKEDAIKDCWYHQLASWVVEDIFDTIKVMNSGHENVLTAPVKRFLSLSFTMGLKRARSGGGGVFRGLRGRSTQGQGKENVDRPTYVITANDGLTESCTGRLCGEDIHTIHFNIAFVVSASEVLPFIDALCSLKEHQFKGYPEGQEPAQTFKHNQITVLESKMGFLNPQDATHRYYRYGQGNAVELDLVCEYVLKKKGYETILPEPVKKTLAGEEEEKP